MPIENRVLSKLVDLKRKLKKQINSIKLLLGSVKYNICAKFQGKNSKLCFI